MIKIIYKGIESNILNIEDENTIYLKSTSEYNDFYNKLILTDNIILKEEKETLFFYSCLDNNAKKILGIKTYFDSIDKAYNYYSLIDELYQNKIKKTDIKIEKWQEKYIDLVYDIHEKMIEKATSEKIVPRYLSLLSYKINENYIKNINKIIIVNKMYTSKEELKILESLGIDIEYHLYIDKNDFNEEKMILENISMPKIKNNVESYCFKDTNSMLIYLTEYLEENRNIELTINDINKEPDYKGINENLLNYNKKNYLNKSKSYKLLNHILNIFNSFSYKINKIELTSVYYAIIDNDFIDFFDIELDEINSIKKNVKNTKKYINKDEYNFLNTIFNLEIDDLTNKIAEKYKDEAASFLEAVTEIKVLDEFDFSKYITDIKDKIKLILKYLDNKTFNRKLDTTLFNITNPDENEISNYILLNAQADLNIYSKNYLLNIKQRRELGLLLNNDFKFVAYYKYIRKIYLSKNSKIIHIKDVDNDIDIKSILNLFLIENEIKSNFIEYSTKQIIEHIKYINKDKNKVDMESIFLTKADNIKNKESDFELMRINAYNIYDFFNNALVYMMNLIINKSEINTISLDDFSISPQTIGNIFHKIIENALEKKVDNISELILIKNKILNDYRDYIKEQYFNLYDYILFSPNLYKILKYVKEMNKYEIITEKEIQGKINEVKIKFYIDIYAKIDDEYELIDIKTGKPKMGQLIAYKVFSEYFENIKVKKTKIYNVYDGISSEFEKDYNFSLENFKERLAYISSLKEYQVIIDKNNKDYNLFDIIRGENYEL